MEGIEKKVKCWDVKGNSNINTIKTKVGMAAILLNMAKKVSKSRKVIFTAIELGK